ncbi:MAG: tetratricopeptide repeat protein [Planctomycetota bacterium]
MLASRARNLLGWLRKHWHGSVFVLALLSLFLLRHRLQVEERRVAAGKDALEVAQDEYADGQEAAAARTVGEFLDRYPKHPSRADAFFLLAECRIRLSQADGNLDRLVLALHALHAAEAEDEPYQPAIKVRAKRLEVARLLRDQGALRDALGELESLSAADASLHMEVAETAEELIDEVDPARVAAVTAAGLVPPGPAAALERLSALQRAMRSPMLEKALAALEAYARAGKDAHLDALARRGRLYLRRRFYAEAVDALTALLAEVERNLPWDRRDPLYPDRFQPGKPWPRHLSVVARDAYESRGLVHFRRMRTWADPELADLEYLLAVNDLGRAEELARRDLLGRAEGLAQRDLMGRAEEAARRDLDAEAADRTGYLVARACQVHGDIPVAIARYQRLLSRSHSPVAEYACLARLGQVFLARGDEAKGLDLLARALSKVSPGTLSATRFPDLPVPSLLLAAFPGDRSDAERLEDAARVAEAFLVHFASDPALQEVVGSIRRRLGDLAAKAAEGAARRGQPREAEDLRARAHYDRAARAFEAGADASRGSRALKLRQAAGVAFARAGDPFRAIAHLTAYLDVCPRDDTGQPEAMYEVARATQAIGDYDRALLLFDRLAVEFPNNPIYTYPSWLDVAKIFDDRGDLDGEIRVLNRVLTESDRIDPTSEIWKRAKFEIGRVRYDQARQRKADRQVDLAREASRAARRDLEQALTYFPEEARLGILALDTLAQIAVEDGDWGKALDHLDGLLALGDVTDDQGNAAKLEEPYASVCNLALVRRADCEFRLDRLADAARSYGEAYNLIQREAESLDCLHRRAVCQKRLGQNQEAAETLEKARAALARLVEAREIDEARRARWQGLLDQGTAGLLTWQFGG